MVYNRKHNLYLFGRGNAVKSGVEKGEGVTLMNEIMNEVMITELLEKPLPQTF